jgi:hypothetical protein
MRNIDSRDKLKENPFTYMVTKASKTFIYYEGKQIMILNEKATKKLLTRIEDKPDFDIQLELAKITGNFKHGNEK